MIGYVDGKVMFGTPAGAQIFNGSTWSTAAGVGNSDFKKIAGNASEMYALAANSGIPVVTKSVNGGANFSSFVTGAQIQSALFPTASDCAIQGLAFSNGKPLISVKVIISSVASCRILKYTGSTWVEEAFTPTNSNDMSIFNSSTNLYCRETTGMGALTLWSTPYGAPSIPTEVTGVVTVANTGGTITLTQDMTVTAAGDLTLDVAELDNLVGTNTIHVQAGGKIKLTGGQQITVASGTLYDLKL
jgi:hypothetical protein